MLQDSLDILVEVLGRCGQHMQEQHSALLATLLPHLDDHRQGVRKRALQAVGECSAHLLVCILLGWGLVDGGCWCVMISLCLAGVGVSS